MRSVLVAGITRTAEIDGISAAGANPAVMVHTPSADAEIVEYGQLVRSPVIPVSPSGCPTPAVITRAVRELLGFELTVIDAGLAKPTGAPTVSVEAHPGADIRTSDPVPAASEIFEEARALGRALPDDELMIGETIPGGTTTAQGVLSALGEEATVSSSLPENPLALKRDVVDTALTADDLSEGAAAGNPTRAVRCVGDPVLAVVAGLTLGAARSGASVTLAGGTQMVAAAALVRHAGLDDRLSIATTSFIADDETTAIHAQADEQNLALTVTDPGFDESDHVAMQAYVAGEAKEGVGMGGALALADQADISMAEVRTKVIEIFDRLRNEEETGDESEAQTSGQETST